MQTWSNVSRHTPCYICGKFNWCCLSADGAWAICRRMATEGGIHKRDKSGADYWLYRLSENSLQHRGAVEVPRLSRPACADAGTLDRAYRALLDALPLAPFHRQNLRQRGFVEAEIRRRHYRTLPLAGRTALVKPLVEQLGVDLCAQVPGFYLAARDGRCWWSLAGAAGLLIPVRTLDGHIVALKVRVDDPGDGPKYTTISSVKHGGPSPGAQAHVPLHDGMSSDTVRLTEGELKADVATGLSDLLTVSIPGVAMWRRALPVLQALRPQRVLLAFDTDWHTNRHVAHALGQAAFALVKAGYAVQVENWDPTLGKGIDDLLSAGHRPAIQPAAMAFSIALHGTARPWLGRLATVPAEEVPSWR